MFTLGWNMISLITNETCFIMKSVHITPCEVVSIIIRSNTFKMVDRWEEEASAQIGGGHRSPQVLVKWQKLNPKSIINCWAWQKQNIKESLNVITVISLSNLQLKCKKFMRVPWNSMKHAWNMLETNIWYMNNAITNMFRQNMFLETSKHYSRRSFLVGLVKWGH